MADMMAESRYHARMASRARNKFSVKQVPSLTKPGVYSDGGGLYLRVREAGRSWFFIGTYVGRRFELGLGSAVDVSLARARERADEIRTMLLDGKDPRTERARAKAALAPALTFGAFAQQLVADIADGFKNPKHRQQWRNTLDTYAKPIADRPISLVSTEDVLTILLPIWLTKPETASRVRGRIERVLDAAKAKGLRGGENPARYRGHLDLLLPKRDKTKVKHHAALPFAEVAAFIADLRARPAVAARALEFTILTAARSGEVRGMTWEELDIEAKVWTVPASRMKAGAKHEVPLSDAAVKIVTAMQSLPHDPDDYVFRAPRGGQFSDMALTALLKRMGRSGITAHGFRSTFRDWAGDKTAFERETVELALAHTIGSKVELAYRRGRALEKRRELMSAWADYCAGKA